MTWRAGPAGELTWRAGQARRCDVALRPRGRATVDPREAQVALTRGKRPRGRVHAGATWHGGGGVRIWRPTGIVRPW